MPPGEEQSLVHTGQEFTANFSDLQQCPDAVVARTITVWFRAPGDQPLMLLADRRSVAAASWRSTLAGFPMVSGARPGEPTASLFNPNVRQPKSK
jgi:hypothetical protein